MSIANISSVAARTKLAVLHTGAWRATRLHKGETRAENARHNTDTAKVLVRISDHPALHGIGKVHAQAYAEHKRLTLPTVQDGMRLLPVGRELEHSAVMRKFADKHNKLVAKFMAEYDAERLSAPSRLNGLFDESMWQPHDVVASKFTFHTRYLTTPTDGAWGDWLAESAHAAENELRERLEKALLRVRDRCRSDGKLFATVFDSVRELVEWVPDLDFSADFAPVVQAMEPLATLRAEQLRDDENGRKQAAEQAANILTMLGGIK